MVRRWLAVRVFLSLVAILFASGCATYEYIKRELGIRDKMIAEERETRQQQVDAIHTRLGEVGQQAAAAEEKANAASAQADEAMARILDVENKVSHNSYVVRETRVVYFDFNKADLKDSAMTSLVEVGRLLKEDPDTIVELWGHADSVGPTQYNIQLSRERAAAVVRYLVQKYGIGTHRISGVGFGEEIPAADNNSPEGQAQNRRVVVRILEPAMSPVPPLAHGP
ncbi:MAG: OmpA family protein [Candidatus Methylomirabilales bacterium]